MVEHLPLIFELTTRSTQLLIFYRIESRKISTRRQPRTEELTIPLHSKMTKEIVNHTEKVDNNWYTYLNDFPWLIQCSKILRCWKLQICLIKILRHIKTHIPNFCSVAAIGCNSFARSACSINWHRPLGPSCGNLLAWRKYQKYESLPQKSTFPSLNHARIANRHLPFGTYLPLCVRRTSFSVNGNKTTYCGLGLGI